MFPRGHLSVTCIMNQGSLRYFDRKAFKQHCKTTKYLSHFGCMRIMSESQEVSLYNDVCKHKFYLGI